MADDDTSQARRWSIDELGIGLDDLIEVVTIGTPADDPTARVAVAVAVGERLGELGDHLIGHFVDQARHSGASWREIGESLGVTKQAAQKRFVPGKPGGLEDQGLFQRFTPRAMRVLEVAHEAAREAHNPEVRPEHLLLGLVADPEGLSARALASQGVSADHVRGAVAAAELPSVADVGERVPFSTDTKKVLELALREALRRNHNYIGTEHLLLGAMAEDAMGSARILRGLGATEEATSTWLDQFLVELVAERTTRQRDVTP